MENMIKVLASVVLLFVAIDSHAGGKWFVDRPAIMNGADHYECVVGKSTNPFRPGKCVFDDLPTGNKRVLMSTEQRQWVENLSSEQFVECNDTLCMGSGETYFGQSESWSYVVIPAYYYIWGSEEYADGNGIKYQLYKRGTGPAADRFPSWYVENDTPPPPRVGGRGELEVHRYNIRYLDCSQGNDNQCLVEVGDYRELNDVTELGLFRVEDIKAVLDPADLGPDMDIFLPDCWDGQCLTFKGVFMGWDPNYPAFQ